MARESYLTKTGEEKNIHSMTTRELRGYIYDKARDAQQRLDTVKMEDTTKAFREAASDIIGRYGKVMKSTSNMTKAEMREYAYKLRQFESLDNTSRFAKSVEWKQNRAKYESFIRTQLEDPLFRKDFEKYLTKKGKEQYAQYQQGNIELKDITGISQKGYHDYKNYISFLSNINNIIEAYGYETVKEYAVESRKDPQRGKVIERLLFKIYEDNKGIGLTQAELAKKFRAALHAYDKRQTSASKAKKPTVKVKHKSKGGKSSSNTIKTKTVGKMRTHGAVRERLT